MHFPSLSNLLERASATFRRFPLTLISAFVAAYLVLSLIAVEFSVETPFFYEMVNGMMACSIGLSFFTALSLFSEVRAHSNMIRYSLQAGTLLLLCWYFYSLPTGELTRYELLRYMIYNFSGHLLVAFLPYLGKKEYEGFWGYNKSLFLQILTSALYSAILFGGLAIALVAVDNLFEVEIEEQNYARLFVVITLIFNTWFFLSGVPSDFRPLDASPSYPKGLKIFTQYVLLPIITIYMAILYAYMGRIIISGIWPEGWVSWLVLCFSVAGILALLLVWPVRNEEGNTWMRMYAKGFYFALFPLVIMLFLSIRIRVLEYGVTEGRYYVVLLAIWLAAIAAYFLISKVKSIKVIPLSLFVIGLLSVHGPWSAFSISQNSQFRLLKGFLDKNNMLVSGKVVPAKGEINREDHFEIQEKVEYLCDVHGYSTLQEIFDQDLASLMTPDSGSRFVDEDGRILALMNLPRISRYENGSQLEYNQYTFSCTSSEPYSISGFEYFVGLNFGEYRDQNQGEKSLVLGADTLSAKWNSNAGQLEVTNGEAVTAFDLNSMSRKIYDTKKGEYYRDSVPVTDMILDGRLDDLSVRILVRSVSGKHMVATNAFQATGLRVELLVGK